MYVYMCMSIYVYTYIRMCEEVYMHSYLQIDFCLNLYANKGLFTYYTY